MLENQFSSAGVNDDAKRHLGQKAQRELFMCCSGKQFLDPIPGTLVQLKSERDMKGKKRVGPGGVSRGGGGEKKMKVEGKKS